MRMHYDVFNGDADGLCSLLQLRLACPLSGSTQVTGTKRDIQLLAQIEKIRECSVTVLDISLHSNRAALESLLKQRNSILYIDHHFAGDIPRSDLLTHHIDQRPEVCTALLVNSLLKGQFGHWAVCGAFGDNLHGPAEKLAQTLTLTAIQAHQLRETGELLNYNSYGETIADLHVPPSVLYAELLQCRDPFVFFSSSPMLSQLRQGFHDDLAQAMRIEEDGRSDRNRVYFLPDAAWARRISGVFANRKAKDRADAAHALVTRNGDGTWRISVRAPLNNLQGADVLCRKFPTGGGRTGAAGINRLPMDMLDCFLADFDQAYR